MLATSGQHSPAIDLNIHLAGDHRMKSMLPRLANQNSSVPLNLNGILKPRIDRRILPVKADRAIAPMNLMRTVRVRGNQSRSGVFVFGSEFICHRARHVSARGEEYDHEEKNEFTKRLTTDAAAAF